MRGFVTWFLGFMLVGQLLLAFQMLHLAYIQGISASNEQLLDALKGQYNGWTVMVVFVLISLVLFVILSRAVRKDLGKAGRR
jgi:hypothetical protein